jgi:hypothetical protein
MFILIIQVSTKPRVPAQEVSMIVLDPTVGLTPPYSQ